MKTSTKLWIDENVGKPIIYCLNFVVQLLGKILRIDHSFQKPVKTIVICKFKGMGSIVQATPLIQTLRTNYPDARILFVTEKANRGICELIPAIDKVLVLDDSTLFSLVKSIFTVLPKLWEMKVDYYFDLEIYSNFSSLFTTVSIARNRFGYFSSGKEYRMGIYTHMMFFNVNAPISEVYLQFARLIGCQKIESALWKPSSTSFSENLTQQLRLSPNQNIIVINPNASDLRIERRWPASKFSELISTILTQYPEYKIVLIGNRAEAEYVNSIANGFQNNSSVINSSGKLSLTELICLIANSKLMVTNDTGPMHLGFACRIKVVALFGPCSPVQYGGSENSISLYKNVYCSPCVHEFLVPPCKGNNVCMQGIQSKEVILAIEQILMGKANSLPTKISFLISENQNVLGVVQRAD